MQATLIFLVLGYGELGLLGDTSGLVNGRTKLSGNVEVSAQAVKEETKETDTRVSPALGARGHLSLDKDGLKDHDEDGTERGRKQPKGGGDGTELATGLNVGELNTGG